jgi:hypothetical protein
MILRRREARAGTAKSGRNNEKSVSFASGEKSPMYRYPVTILLILLVAAQSFSKWCLIVEFQANRDLIARNFCVNRLNPISCCKGTCFLTKRLADDENKQAPVKGSQQEEVLLQVHRPANLLPEPVAMTTLVRHATRYVDRAAQEYLPSFFAPPRMG